MQIMSIQRYDLKRRANEGDKLWITRGGLSGISDAQTYPLTGTSGLIERSSTRIHRIQWLIVRSIPGMKRQSIINIGMDSGGSRIDNQHTIEAVRCLLIAKLVRVIPVRASVRDNEAIDIGLARFHRILGNARYPIGGIGDTHAMPVNGHAKGKTID